MTRLRGRAQPCGLVPRCMARFTAPAFAALLAAIGCAGEAGTAPMPPACVAVSLDCTPAYTPTYERIYLDVFRRQCAGSTTGSSCHYAADGVTAAGELALSDPDHAYQALLGQLDGRARVVPEDPQCSLLVARLESSDPGFRMPPVGNIVPEAARCAIRQWIEMGALR